MRENMKLGGKGGGKIWEELGKGEEYDQRYYMRKLCLNKKC